MLCLSSAHILKLIVHMLHKHLKNFNFIELWSFFLISGFFIPLATSAFPFLKVNIGLPIISVISYIPFIFLLGSVLWNRRKSYKYRFNLTNIFLFTLATLVLASKILALFYVLKDMNAPILHDVVEHALMAKNILVEDKINFFYSPLLHSIAATLSLGDISEVPRLIVAVTHLSVIMIPVQFSLLFYYYTKNTKLTIFVFILLCSLHFPANMYYRAGKNSLILALSLIPVCIFSFDRLFKNKSFTSVTSLVISLLLLFFAHYPTFGILLFMVSPWLLIEFYSVVKNKEYRKLLYYISPLLISLLFAFIWFTATYHIQEQLLVNSVKGGEPLPRVPITFELLRNNLRVFYEDYISRYFNTLYVVILIPILSKIGGIRIKVTLVWAFASLIFLYTSIYTLQVDRVLGMVPNTMEIIYPSMMIFIGVFLISYITFKIGIEEKWFIFCFLFISMFSILSSYYLFKTVNEKHDQLNVISENDLKAFQFINTHLDKGSIFLNGAVEDINRKGFIFPSDGAMWLPLYTDSKVVFDFRQVTNIETNNNYKLLVELKTETNDLPILDQFKTEGVKYGYIDEGVFGESLHEDFLNGIPYETIFSEGTVRIIEFK